MGVLLLFFLVSNVFTALFAMDDARHGLPFHQVVHEVETGCEPERAKKTLESLCVQGKDPNVVSKGKTAAGLIAYFCVNNSSHFDNHLEILKFFLNSNEKVSSSHKKDILEYLNKEKSAVDINLVGFKRGPFQKTQIYGGGYFIDDDDYDDNEKRLNDELRRINQVRELVEELE